MRGFGTETRSFRRMLEGTLILDQALVPSSVTLDGAVFSSKVQFASSNEALNCIAAEGPNFRL